MARRSRGRSPWGGTAGLLVAWLSVFAGNQTKTPRVRDGPRSAFPNPFFQAAKLVALTAQAMIGCRCLWRRPCLGQRTARDAPGVTDAPGVKTRSASRSTSRSFILQQGRKLLRQCLVLLPHHRDPTQSHLLHWALVLFMSGSFPCRTEGFGGGVGLKQEMPVTGGVTTEFELLRDSCGPEPVCVEAHRV